MSDKETWEEACKRAGAWKRGEKCRVDFLAGKKGMILIDAKRLLAIRNWTCDCRWRHVSMLQLNHDIPCPPIGDPGATLAMLEWLGKQDEMFSLHSATSDDGERGWSVLVAEKYIGHLRLCNALAAAVCALPKEGKSWKTPPQQG